MTGSGPAPSPLGFGTYRWAATPEHVAALHRARDLGCTLVDTAPNYAPAEVRAALGRLLGVRREEVHVISKGGYTDDGGYTLDPPFLRCRLETEARLVGSGYLDTFLLHNPEHLLARWPVERVLDAVTEAFAVCGEAVAAGTIRSFGVSSNVLALPQGDLGQTAVEVYARLAREAGAAEGFGFVQFPHNLVEASALTGGWLDRCRTLGLRTLGNRPLTVRTPQGPLRIADPPPPTAPRPSAQVLADLDRHTPAFAWLSAQWHLVASSDALDHVEGLVREQLCAGGDATTDQLTADLVAARRHELRATAARRTRELLASAGCAAPLGDPGEPVVLRACRGYLSDLDHVLVGMRTTADVDRLATLFAPRPPGR